MATYLFHTLSLSTRLAIVSFTLGTLLLGSYFLFPYQIILIKIGIIYLLFAIITNSIMLLWLIYNCFLKPYRMKQIGIEILVLLANIPVVILYLSIILKVPFIQLLTIKF